MKKALTLVLAASVILLSAIGGAPAGAQIIDPILEDQVIVRLHPGHTIGQFNAQYGSSTIRSIHSRSIHLVETPQGTTAQQFELLLQNNPPAGLRWVELNYEGQDGESRTGSFYVSSIEAGGFFHTQYPWDLIDLGGAQSVTGGEGIVIALIDTGIDATHPFLAGRLEPGGYNFIDRNTNTDDVRDFKDNDNDGVTDEAWGHGTFSAGLIAKIAPDATLLPIKALDSDGVTHNFHIAEGIFFAVDRGVDVINLSLGSTYESLGVEDALNEALQAGIVVTGAGGNQNSASGNTEEYPAVFDQAIGLIATDELDNRAPFSNFHEDLVLSAPGVEIVGTIPLNAQGHRYAEWDGTSFASAIAAGSSALVLAANPDWPRNAAGVAFARGAMLETADPNGWGEGRLDVGAAVLHTPTAAGIAEIHVAHGAHVSGDLTAFTERGDSNVFIARSHFGFSAAEPNLLRLRFVLASLGNPPLMEIKLVQWIDNPGGRGTVQVRNVGTGMFQTVGTYSIIGTPNETRIEFEDLSTANRIAPDGTIEVRIINSVIATFSASGFKATFDEFEVDFD